MITSKLAKTIYERRFQDQLVQTVMRRYKWTQEEFQRVDWDIFGKVFNSYSKFHQISVAKFVHGLWNTGEQQVLFKQDPEGICPCCKQTQETTLHLFQCLAPTMVANRSEQLVKFQEFLAQQDLPKPVKECMLAGLTEWTRSVSAKPKLHAPTRGKLMPAEQMATAAFSEQTSLGWDAFSRGHLSQYWRRAILLSNPTYDEDATETFLRRILRKLHSFSLAVWESRNGIVHGVTRDEAKEMRSKLIKGKVAEAFQRFSDRKIWLLPRDHSLFTKKTMDERLKGDDDALLCWLRSVEVAMAAFERRQT